MATESEEHSDPLWVQRMRADGYTVRIGSGELSEVPDFMFEPLPEPESGTSSGDEEQSSRDA